jgi:CubicO group peptidase (beta-lactamase class C family)
MKPPADFKKFNYSWGWILSENIFHLGGDAGFGSLILVQPDKNKALIMLSNLNDSWKLMREII